MKKETDMTEFEDHEDDHYLGVVGADIDKQVKELKRMRVKNGED